MSPVLLVIAGPNGAGKATVTARLRHVGTADPRINATRFASRFMEGGHVVPIDKIVNRYARSMANLPVAMTLADRAYVYDNSIEDVEARLCFRTQEGLLRKVYCDLRDWVADAAQALQKHPPFVDVRVA